MKVLLVEDQKEEVDIILEELGDVIDFDVAQTRDEALQYIESSCYDVAVCDLKIPATPGAMPEVLHGLAVLTAIRERFPGTPVIAFTANRTTEVMSILLKEQRQGDYLGTTVDAPMLSAIDKDDLPEFLSLLRDLSTEFALLEQVQVVHALGEVVTDALTQRVLRIYARQRGCTISRIDRLTHGQSGIPVLRVSMERADGSAGGSAVARLGPVSAIIEERRRYQQRVSGFLPLGSYAEIVDQIQVGAAGLGGIFYQIAKDYESLFAVLKDDDERAAAAINRLQVLHEPWRDRAPAADMLVREIRRCLLDDAQWAESLARCNLDEARVQEIETITVPVRRATTHGDLHGENVLVHDEPVVIDFLSVDDGPTPLDPVSLELSVLFHPHAPVWDAHWPSLAQLENWADFNAYSAGSPFPKFLEACRQWAMSVARGNRDLHACRYAYVASQSRFTSSSEEYLSALMADLPDRLR